jgi:hypothetical protein
MPASTGFSLGFRYGLRSFGIALVVGLGIGTCMALADLSLFAGIVPVSQKQLLGAPSAAFIGALVLYDELVLRLGGLTALTWLLGKLARRQDQIIHWIAIVLTAGLLWPLSARGYLATLDWSALAVLREVTLHGGAGLAWGWLCWRHGWLAGLTGHLAAYGALVPMLGS